VSVAALRLDGIVKRFGDVAALDGASLTVAAGSVHAVLGENGAGKTTLMRIAFGMLRPDAGTVVVDGTARTFRSPADAIAVGVGMVHQHFALVGAMTVAENVALAETGWRYDRRRAADRVRAIADETGLAIDPDARVADLSVGQQQRVEIVKALSREGRVLILDEPTAVLDPETARELLAWLRRFAARGGAAVLVTHKLRDALAVADAATVLRLGATVLESSLEGSGALAGSIEDRETALARAMLGATPSAALIADSSGPTGAAPTAVVRDNESGPTGAVVVDADGVEIDDARGVRRIRGATFALRAGEIVGVAGIEGEGQLELLGAIAGRLPIAGGRLTGPPAAAIGFVPEDRQRDAMVLDFSLVENVALRGAGAARGRLPWARLGEVTAALIGAFDVRGGDGAQTARALSGGNQQKLVLARELDGGPRLLVVENPTRGLDIRAAAQVRAQLRAARDSGTAVVVYSSDLDEVIALADRVLVVARGAVQAVPVAGGRDTIGRAMLGLAEATA
jgi:simple sugar transport system ATP-binding protein